MKSNSKHKVSALTKKGVAMFIAAALMALIALFGITACPNNVEGGAVTGTANGGNTGGLKWHEAPFVEGGASLILSPDKLTIRVTVTTSDNSPITVEGCDKTELTSGTRTELKAKGTKVVLKGKITKLKVGEWNSNDSNKLTALNVQGLSALQELDCDKNQLTALNVQGCTALQTLGCNENQLTELNVQGLNALEFLYCRNNQLTSLNTQGCTAFYILYCDWNQLTALNVQGCTALQKLWCDSNQLTALNVQGCIALENLKCSLNKLTALNVQGCTALHSLSCGENQLTELNVQGLNALNYLDCWRNQLTELNVQGLSALEFLYCNENQLTSLNTQGCTALKTLSCGVNQLTADAFTKLFNDLPQRTANAGAECHLYTEQSGVTEGNHKDFTAPPDLAAAFNKAKTVKKWKMSKYNGSWSEVVI